MDLFPFHIAVQVRDLDEARTFYDPSGNALEFKGFKDMAQLFEK